MIDYAFTLVLLKTTSSNPSYAVVFLLGPILAGAFFSYIWHRYRNTDKSYQFEATTHMEVTNVSAEDEYTGHISKTTETRVEGHSLTSNPRSRIPRF